MNKYESVIILNPELEEMIAKEIINRIANIINDFAERNKKDLEIEDLGIKKLAYQVKKYKEGRYVLYTFYAEPNDIMELERVYRILDDVIKFIVVRKDEDYE